MGHNLLSYRATPRLRPISPKMTMTPDVVPQRRPHYGQAGEPAIVRGPAASHPPETFHHIELRTITRQPIHLPRWIGGEYLVDHRPPMPRRLITRDDPRGICRRRVRAGTIPPMHRKGRWPPLLFAAPGLRCAAGGLLQHASRQPARHHSEGGEAVDAGLISPRPHPGTVPLAPQGRAQRRHQGTAGFILAPPHACHRL